MTEKNKKILLAEDEASIARLVEFKLSREGYDVFIAKNGQVAIEHLFSQPWSVLILDIMMPVLDGWEVLKKVRAIESLKSLPVLMLTAKGQQKDLASAIELGANEFLRKPFDPDELVEVVKKLLSRSST